MTRREVDKHGYIQNPGKFEGEMLYAPYFYDAVLMGDGERIGDTDFFEINDDDAKEFPELTGCYGVTLVESENGFV